MGYSLLAKLQRLSDWFKQQMQITVAYSGGVDSALLLYIGTQVLGSKRCRGLFADSCLVSRNARDAALAFSNDFNLDVRSIPLSPLDSDQFVKNNDTRCYVCKSNTYSFFLKMLPATEILIDGTNTDDLDHHRPGLKVLQELGVATPYLDCSISKFDIRALSYHCGLPVWDTLSESCLATRILSGQPITLSQLDTIEQIESELCQRGFAGCRVQIRMTELFVSLHTGECEQILNKDMLKLVEKIKNRYKFTKVFLDLFEREGILPSLLDYIGFEGRIVPAKQFLSHFKNMSGFS